MVISRLKEVPGFAWSFRVVSQGTTDVEAWVLGEMTATFDGVTVVRQQYGAQELMRGSRTVTDLFKSAATDAIKKCATTLGVGLYLYDADERGEVEAEMREANRPAPLASTTGSRASAAPAGQAAARTPAAASAGSSTRSTTATAAVQSANASAVLTGASPVNQQQRWQRLVTEAERFKLPTLGKVKAIDPKAVSERQLKVYADQLEERLYEVRNQGAA
jgi:hypothetical protein